MEASETIKESVRQKYTEIALQDKDTNMSSCCGADACSTDVYNIMSDDYARMKGYNPDADLGLGCGLPTQFAKIKKGDVVIDLGSGAGNDCFIARHETGEAGKVIGIDFTEAMIQKARANAEKLQLRNVEFRQGDIEKLPVSADTADVVISNCVLNLVPDKEESLKEIYRVLKPGGHFSISDVVLIGELPEPLVKSAEMYAGCVAGALHKSNYLSIIHNTGFKNVIIQKENPIVIPDDILLRFISSEELDSYKKSDRGIFSITVYGEKATPACCQPGCCQ
jgi:SAM-dependent methyltransferase